MKHLIVVAHPAEDSFTMSLAKAYAAELKQLGHDVRVYDVYREHFDPILRANERASEPTCPPDVARAQDEIRSAEVLTVLYPLWWLSMPAIMKGYIDRVFARGFAYESREGIVRGLLFGKQAVMVTLSGAPLPLLVKSGNWNAVQTLQDTHIFQAAGFELLEHLHFDEVVPNLPIAIIEKHLARVRSCAREHFSSNPSFGSRKAAVA